jgi:hypothetical protein
MNPQIEAFRRKIFDEVILAARAQERGSISLGTLLDILAGSAFQDAGGKPSRDELNRANLEYYEGFRTLLGNAKRSILEGRLIVRQLTTLAPVNAEPGIRAWCNENDTLKNADEMRPHGRMVVKLEDARSWLTDNGILVPEWLHALALQQPNTAEQPKGDESAVEQPEGSKAPEPKSHRQEHRILEIICELGYDPKNLPKSERGKPGVRALIREKALNDQSLFTKETFRKAWNRVLADIKKQG